MGHEQTTKKQPTEKNRQMARSQATPHARGEMRAGRLVHEAGWSRESREGGEVA